MQSESEEQNAPTASRCSDVGRGWISTLRLTVNDGTFFLDSTGTKGNHLPSGASVRVVCTANGMEIFRPSVNPVFHYQGVFEPDPKQPGEERVHGTRTILTQLVDRTAEPQDQSLAALLPDEWIAEKGT
jgi:hypothetical protein